jgi:hypothetical protein
MASIGVRSGKNPTKEFWPIPLHLPKAYTADANGADVDRSRNGGYFALTLMLLPGLWTDGTHAFIIEEADDNGAGAPDTYAAVAAADVIGGVSGTFVSITAATTTVQRIDYIGRKRWVRCRYDYTAGSTGAVFAVVALLFSPAQYPAA